MFCGSSTLKVREMKFRMKKMLLKFLFWIFVICFGLFFSTNLRKHKHRQKNGRYWSGVGYCDSGKSLLDFIPHEYCSNVTCLELPKRKVFLYNLIYPSWLPYAFNKVLCYAPAGGQLYLHANSSPQVSFILTVYNNPLMAARALIDMFRFSREVVSAEFIIVDDGSDVDMFILTNLVKNLKYYFSSRIVFSRNSIRQGYGFSNNKAFMMAKGQFLMILNSDVKIYPGCFSLMLWTMQNFNQTGMVGPLMLSGDGLVSESGGHLFQRGLPANYGRGLKVLDLPLKHAREVDYISAACVLVRREAIVDKFLFDPTFAPAYFEDTDLAVRILLAGWRVFVQPLAVVEHFEGSTISRDEKNRLMKKNQYLFSSKHATALESLCSVEALTDCQPDLRNAMGVSFAHRHTQVLFLDYIAPQFDKDSGSFRLLKILQILLSFRLQVYFEPLAAFGSPRYLINLLAQGVYYMKPGTTLTLSQSIMPCPWKLIFIARKEVYELHYDYILKFCPMSHILFDTVDLHFLREKRAFKVEFAKRQADNLELRDWSVKKQLEIKFSEDNEMAFIKNASVAFVVSQVEIDLLARRNITKNVVLLSNIYNVPKTNAATETDFSHRHGGIFVGSSCHTPNIDAMTYIVNEILDLLPSSFILHIVSSQTTVCPLPNFISDHKKVVMYKDISDVDLIDLHSRVLFLLAPLRYGAGVKGKVNFALLHGVPVIASRIAVEGMHLHHETNVLLANSSQEYANSILRLSTDANLWKKISINGMDVMRNFFSVDVASKTILSVLASFNMSLLEPAWKRCRLNCHQSTHDNEKNGLCRSLFLPPLGFSEVDKHILKF